jgi:tRNA(Ile)-lysidine synthase
VNHGLRPDASHDATLAATSSEKLCVAFRLHEVDVPAGPNLEARARAARYSALPPGVATGHTADDQAETVLLRLLRGTGPDGLASMTPGTTHPILAVRRFETHALCADLGLSVADDVTNRDPAHRRNRVRHEVVPLLADVAGRDIVPLLVRTAGLARDDGALLDELAATIDPTDARALRDAPTPLARRALRRWLAVDGYPPHAAAIERVLAVVAGTTVACEVDGGRRVVRTEQRLRVVDGGR